MSDKCQIIVVLRVLVFVLSLFQGKQKDGSQFGEYGGWYKACKVDRSDISSFAAYIDTNIHICLCSVTAVASQLSVFLSDLYRLQPDCHDHTEESRSSLQETGQV